MDKLVYTAMTGVKHILEQQATVAHNLANASTTGFRAQLDSFRAVPIVSQSLPTRTFVVDATVGSDFTPGTIQQTGSETDMAVQGSGWFAVQLADGSEAYTRNGSFKVSENGLLQTQNNLSVQGEGGPISVPPGSAITIAKDGTISTIESTFKPGPVNILGKLKLVNPPENTLVRGDDGLFRTKDGKPAEADQNVAVVGGALETSNVNPIDSMVNMVNLARQFEMSTGVIKHAEDNATKASQIMALS